MKGYTNVINRVFTKVVYLLRKQHVSVHTKRPNKQRNITLIFNI